MGDRLGIPGVVGFLLLAFYSPPSLLLSLPFIFSDELLLDISKPTDLARLCRRKSILWFSSVRRKEEEEEKNEQGNPENKQKVKED